MSANSYGIDDQIFFSYPLNITQSKIEIISNISLTDDSSRYIKISEKELISERDIIKDLL